MIPTETAIFIALLFGIGGYLMGKGRQPTYTTPRKVTIRERELFGQRWREQ